MTIDGAGGESDRDAPLARHVEAAAGGDADALAQVIAAIGDRVFGLALRMTTRPVEAEDAAQEIIIKVMTRLGSFRGEAAFTTWVHRIAVNHLLDMKKSSTEELELDFDSYGQDLRIGLAEPPDGPDAGLLVDEVRLSCTQAMLTCLDREHRVAYVLAEVFEVSSTDGAYICDVSPEAYRKRVSRARTRIRSFVGQHCGLVDQAAPCRCDRRVETAVRLGRIDPDNPEFATLEATGPAERATNEMERLLDAASLFRSHPDYAAPLATRERVRTLIRSGDFRLLLDGDRRS